MPNTYCIKGLDPLGNFVELSLLAETQLDAKKLAEDAGLRFVLVEHSPPQPTEAPPTQPLK